MSKPNKTPKKRHKLFGFRATSDAEEKFVEDKIKKSKLGQTEFIREIVLSGKVILSDFLSTRALMDIGADLNKFSKTDPRLIPLHQKLEAIVMQRIEFDLQIYDDKQNS